MKSPNRKFDAFTLVELLVVISIIAILVALAFPGIAGALARAGLTQATSNAKQIHTAQLSMAMEGVSTGDTNWTWVGDQPTISSVQAFASWLVTNGFLHGKDAAKVFATAGIPVAQNASSNSISLSSTNNGFKFYKVTDRDPGVTIFITTKNYSYNEDLSKESKPFGDAGFVVFRKSGDGTVFRQAQARQTNLLGPLPENDQTPLSDN